MTTVNGDPFAALNTGTTGAATTAKKADTLGQADFMRLMTEQLANQDPLKPLSNSEFVAQLAQFSTVQGISDLNTTVNGFTALRICASIVRWIIRPSPRTAGEIADSPPICIIPSMVLTLMLPARASSDSALRVRSGSPAAILTGPPADRLIPPPEDSP